MSDVLEAMECTRIVATVRLGQYDQAVEVTLCSVARKMANMVSHLDMYITYRPMYRCND
jgi:hypothetical protein